MIAVSREQLAWAAGFFDGEGHVARLKYRGKTHINVSLQIGNTDKELLERFFAVIGKLGNIYGPFHKKPRLGSIYKPYWMWTSRRFEHAQAVCAMLWHWLGETRRTQMAEMLKGAGSGRWPKSDPIKLAEYKKHMSECHLENWKYRTTRKITK